tara:strand:- start:1162 stop:1302 length:141 start_codon:yes stop_codon:yes gene_type:complete
MTKEEYYDKVLEVLEKYAELEPNFGSRFTRSMIASEITESIIKEEE